MDNYPCRLIVTKNDAGEQHVTEHSDIMGALTALVADCAADNAFLFIKAECIYDGKRQWCLSID